MISKRSSSLVTTAALVAAGSMVFTGASAQQGEARPPQRTVPVRAQVEQEPLPQFGAAIDRVLVDVVVQDKAGNFVPDLTAGDFEVLEEGEPVDVTFFALERFRESMPVRLDDDGVPAEDGAGMDPALAAAPLLPRYMVLFVDGFNTSPQDWDNVRYALHQYLDKYLQANDRILLATLTPRRRLMVAPEFTRDIGSIKRSIDEFVSNPAVKERERRNQQDLLRMLYEDSNSLTILSAGADEQGLIDQEANMLRQGASMAQVFAGQRKDEILFTLNAMTALGTHLNTTFDVPGPKTMIMVSAGISQTPGAPYYFILDARLDQASARSRTQASSAAEHPVAFRSRFTHTIERYMMRAVGQLNRLNYTVYTIGARGTAIGAMPGVADRYVSNLKPGIASIAYQGEEEGLRTIAHGTGGLPFANSANFNRAFEDIDRDTAFRYVLGYAPPQRPGKASADKFYRIQVNVDRDDVTVRSRRGYVEG